MVDSFPSYSTKPWNSKIVSNTGFIGKFNRTTRKLKVKRNGAAVWEAEADCAAVAPGAADTPKGFMLVDIMRKHPDAEGTSEIDWCNMHEENASGGFNGYT